MRGLIRSIALCAVAMALAACGGGGGNPGTSSSGGSGITGGSSGGGSTSGGSTVAQPSVAVAIFNSGNTATTSVASGNGYTARATLLDASGAPVANKLVNFSLNGASVAALTPDTALTNGSGVAQVALAASSISAVGAATLSASAVIGTTTVSQSTDFAVTPASLTLSPISAGAATLPSGGNTSLSVTASIGGSPSTGVPVNVTFAVSCGRINGAGSSFSVTTNGNGVASASYTAVNADGSLCSGPVTVSASSAGAAPSSATVTVASPTANAVTFVLASPMQIAVAGTGALEQSVLRFKVLSAGGTGLANVPVTFSLQTNPGGVSLGTQGSSTPALTLTDAAGEATVSVFSGTIPGPVKVRAALTATPGTFAESQNLSVASGPPSQRFMSLSVETSNIEGGSRDGVSTKLTVQLADRQGNAVQDGTVVNFTAEGGQVASSCATTQVAGIAKCSVDFVSQNPRPTGGRVSVLAFAEGTKDYVDTNGNNRYDAGTDTLVPLGDAYRDDNENGSFDAGEFVVPRGGALACADAGAPFPSRLNTCDASLGTTVRQQAVILFSASTPAPLEIQSQSVSAISFKLRSAGSTLLPMPAGTTVSADASGGTCAVDKVFGSAVPNVAPTTNPLTDLATSHIVTLKNCAAGNVVSIKIRTPSGLETITNLTL